MEIQLNIGELEAVAKVLQGYAKALDNLETAISNIQRILVEGNAGQWAVQLSVNSVELQSSINSVRCEIDDISDFLVRYTSEMTGIIAPINRYQKMIVDQHDIAYNLAQIEDDCRLSPKIGKAESANFRHGYSESTGSGATDEETIRNEEENARKIQEIKQDLIPKFERKVERLFEELEQIYENQVKVFQKKDEAFA